ncbi:hypothetical protein RAS1_02270 [Phycisphaerae bacterium RAS1]|nr:hypothetical protein RAS1_02270 [Phycisphaerae bacterium RAS1]
MSIYLPPIAPLPVSTIGKAYTPLRLEWTSDGVIWRVFCIAQPSVWYFVTAAPPLCPDPFDGGMEALAEYASACHSSESIATSLATGLGTLTYRPADGEPFAQLPRIASTGLPATLRIGESLELQPVVEGMGVPSYVTLRIDSSYGHVGAVPRTGGRLSLKAPARLPSAGGRIEFDAEGRGTRIPDTRPVVPTVTYVVTALNDDNVLARHSTTVELRE